MGDDLAKAVEAQQRRERDAAIDRYVQLIGKLLERASAYTKGVIAAGYAAILAAWGFTKDSMPPVARATSALLVLTSVLVFVLWEVYQNISTANTFAGWTERVRGRPETAVDAAQEYAEQQYRRSVKQARAWRAVVVVTFATGLLGALVIMGCIFLTLFRGLVAAL